jgi:hypothetical protein
MATVKFRKGKWLRIDLVANTVDKFDTKEEAESGVAALLNPKLNALASKTVVGAIPGYGRSFMVDVDRSLVGEAVKGEKYEDDE